MNIDNINITINKKRPAWNSTGRQSVLHHCFQ